MALLRSANLLLIEAINIAILGGVLTIAFTPDDGYDAFLNRWSEKLIGEVVMDMKFPGGFNIQQMMKQAQVMQEKMQKEMEELRVEASAGGGVVSVQMKGNHEIIALKIDPEAVKDGDVEMLQDLITAAANEANRKVDEAMKGKLGGMLPPGLGGLLG
jgi:DNA-binding YbaB/EbfC family protein